MRWCVQMSCQCRGGVMLWSRKWTPAAATPCWWHAQAEAHKHKHKHTRAQIKRKGGPFIMSQRSPGGASYRLLLRLINESGICSTCLPSCLTPDTYPLSPAAPPPLNPHKGSQLTNREFCPLFWNLVINMYLNPEQKFESNSQTEWLPLEFSYLKCNQAATL